MGERVMGMTKCNGVFYVATQYHIYRRTDGTNPTWTEVYARTGGDAEDIRGITAVPNPNGQGEVLIFSFANRIRRIDPSNNFQESIELNTTAFLSSLLGAEVSYVLAAYNEFFPYTMPDTGVRVWIVGFEARYAQQANLPPNFQRWASEGRFFIRRANGSNISYQVVEIDDPAIRPKPNLIATRAVAVSPFPNESNVLYFGYDSNSIATTNSAWIYRSTYR